MGGALDGGCGFGGHGEGDLRPVSDVIVNDLQVEGVVELPQDSLGHRGQADSDLRDEVEEFGVLGGRLLVVEVSEFGGFGPSVLGELGGAGVDFAGELAGAVGVFEAAHEPGAACVEVVDVGLEPCELFGVFSGGGECGLVEDVLE
ncbi:hypothetical protein LO762_14670 [Actinocorallia sp. API 0066]|uniref:hypothetical protein n=1 Tax=Actinocorallia sp. API 0066 TaxID=2896846 RepID=UPI001E5E8A1B|nr:hypothetical protein [Actinocorallia sp. API 0066]MCD0450425.1 hypothetical protein [Actinocorallia sp. API 0066]